MRKTQKEKILQLKELWQFYTNKKIALNVFNILKSELKTIIDFDKTIFVEPSAWTGSFIDVIKKDKKDIIAYDIMPKHKDIIQLDFLKSELNIPKNNIFIWNPPFWKRSKMAIDFFNKAAQHTDIIAFIIPNQFKKYSVQSKLDSDFKLIHETDLESDAFFTETTDKYNVNCVFQIWVRKNLTNRENLRILKKPDITHPDFEMFQYNNTEQSLKIFNNEFDFWIFCQWYGNYTEFIYDKQDFNLKKHRILFKASNESVLKKLKNINFEKLSWNNTTVPWFRKWDIVKEYNNLYNK